MLSTIIAQLYCRTQYTLLLPFQDHKEEDLFMYIAYSDESVYGSEEASTEGEKKEEEAEEL